MDQAAGVGYLNAVGIRGSVFLRTVSQGLSMYCQVVQLWHRRMSRFCSSYVAKRLIFHPCHSYLADDPIWVICDIGGGVATISCFSATVSLGEVTLLICLAFRTTFPTPADLLDRRNSHLPLVHHSRSNPAQIS